MRPTKPKQCEKPALKLSAEAGTVALGESSDNFKDVKESARVAVAIAVVAMFVLVIVITMVVPLHCCHCQLCMPVSLSVCRCLCLSVSACTFPHNCVPVDAQCTPGSICIYSSTYQILQAILEGVPKNASVSVQLRLNFNYVFMA